MQWSARRRAVAGVLGALVVHASIALLIALHRAPPASPRATSLPVALLIRPPASRPGSQAPRAGAEPAPARRGTVRARSAPGQQAETGPASEAAPAWSQEWAAAEGVSRGAKGGVSVRLEDGAFDVAPSAPDGPVREKTPAEKLAEEKAGVRRRIEGWTSDVAARERARSAPDHYWGSLRDVLARGFDPGWDVLDKGPGESAGSVRSQFWDSWKREAEAYGRTGKPSEDDGRRPLNNEILTARNEDRGLTGVSLGGTPTGVLNFDVALRGLAGNSFTRSLVATVKITQRDDGSIFAVELFATSGNPAYDRLVLAQARKLDALRMGPPKDGRATLWAFATTFTQIPPAPIAGCALDDFVPKNCFYPLQKLSRSHVTLLAIY